VKKVSILIPAYNEEAYISLCLRSLECLTYPDYEIIVCNNNSTDRTCEIVARHPNVQLVHETIKGPNAARQKALSVSTGEIIATLDADCIAPHDWIERALVHFSNPRVVAVAGVCDFDGAGPLSRALWFSTRYPMKFIHFVTHRVLGKYGIMMAANAWYRKETLLSIGGFNTSIEFFGDDAHTAKMLTKKGRIIYDPSVRVTTSSRRFNQEGILSTAYHYVLNYASMWFIGKSATPSRKTKHYR
jgi:cellulose synthase/poly-beta-1,6-N-acetylglucosamine synthase-like glycosyltransferase